MEVIHGRAGNGPRYNVRFYLIESVDVNFRVRSVKNGAGNRGCGKEKVYGNLEVSYIYNIAVHGRLFHNKIQSKKSSIYSVYLRIHVYYVFF